MAMQEKQEGQQGREKGRRRRRRWPWVLGGVLILIVLVVLLIPVVLSSNGFTRWLQGTIGRSTGGQTDIGDLSVGWLKGVRVTNFRFRTENDWAQVDIDRIATQPSFRRLLGGTLALGRTVIDRPRIAVDLRARPPATTKQSPATGSRSSPNSSGLSRINDLVVRDASIQVTDRTGETVRIADLDSTLSIRQPGSASSFNVEMAVAQADKPGRILASGQITPDKKQGWSLKGTSGDLVVEVNDLNLSSVSPLLALAGVEVQTKGNLSANLTSEIQDGQIKNLNAAIVGQKLDVTGEALKGDRLQTSQLNIRATVTQAKNVIKVDQLKVQTDWADLSVTGTAPTTARSMTELLENGSTYDLKGQFDINLASLLSQIPNTVGVREGMEITGGRATGTINTTTQAGRATVVAEAKVAALAGTVNDQKLSLSEPVLANLRLAADKDTTELEAFTVTAPFAAVNAAGDFKQINYEGKVNLAALKSELGPFINLGPYGIAGQVAGQGQLSIQEKSIGATGDISAQQVVLTAPDGNSVSEPAATVKFALAVDKEKQMMTVDRLTAGLSFGTVNVQKASIPMGEGSTTPLNLVLSAPDVDLKSLKPYLALFASFPREMDLGGMAQSQVVVTREQGVYHVSTDATRIESFRLVSPEKESFEREYVTAVFDFRLDPSRRGFALEDLLLEAPQIRVRFGELTRTAQDNTVKLRGELEAQLDWAAVGQAASVFVPGRVDMAGQRQIAVNFASTYPADDPNGLLANLNASAPFGFDRAEYKGLNFGPTEVDLRTENGLMQIRPFSSTLNKGQFHFAADADLRHTPIFLKTPGPLQMAQSVQITGAMVDTLLRYVNPIFADAVGVSGIVNFASETMALPLTPGHKEQAELVGTISMQEVRLQASLLNKILSAAKESVRDQILVVRPTKIVLQNGVVRYDDMQIDVGDNPINFGGTIGPNGKLDMTVLLPYTYEGRTARVGDREGQRGERIRLPLTGTLDEPQLNLQKLLELQLKDQLRRGIEKLFE